MKNLQGIVSKMAFGGEGVIRNNGLVTFVPYTAIGDTVVYQETEKKKSFARGKLLSLIQNSPDRVEPKCPHFTKCGGCQFQHLHPDAQLRDKAIFVQDALERIAKRSIPKLSTIPSPSPWNYRKHITLKLRPVNGKLLAGYQESDFISVKECPIFAKGNKETFDLVRMFIDRLEPYEGSLRIISTEEGAILAFTFEKEPPSFEKVALSQLDKWKGIALGKKTWGDTSVSLSIDAHQFMVSPYSFMQANSLLAPKLYHHLASLAEGNKILDLYCGSGILSTLLGKKGHQVVGVESSSLAIHYAKQNSEHYGLSIPFHTGFVEKLLPTILKDFHPDTVILNPPRGGVHPNVIEKLQKSGVKRIVYMSCMPSTLARDIKGLAKYELTDLFLYDMFPQTTHLESIAVLTLSSEG
ncbi:MAG: class I SAM-dependent RNA methyltransferase [Candidatus Rhabdochlamydia sp.]